MTEEERGESVRHCKWVDEVICPAPWIITKEFIDEHKVRLRRKVVGMGGIEGEKLTGLSFAQP